MTNPYLWFSLLGIIWGVNFMFMKVAVGVVSPMQVVWLRVLSGCLPLILFGLWSGRLKLREIRHVHHFIAMALFANVLPFYVLVMGTQRLPSGVAGVISGTIPLVTAILASIAVPEERLSGTKLSGLMAGFLGVLLVAEAWNKPWSSGASFQGEGYILLGALCYGIAYVYAKKYVGRLGIPSTSLAAWQTLFASVMLTAMTDLRGLEPLLAHPGALLAAVIGLGVLGTGVANMLNYAIIDRLGAVAASSVTYIPPVIALIVGVVLMGERVSGFQWSGALLILAGIFMVRRGNVRQIIRSSDNVREATHAVIRSSSVQAH